MTLEDKFLKYVERNRILKLDYLTGKWNCEFRNLVELICNHYDSFDNVVFSDEAVYLDYPETQQWYYEVAQGKETNGKKWFNRHNYIEVEQSADFITEHAGLPDWHMSAYQHDNKWIKDFNDKNSKVRVPYIYIELDREGDLDWAIEDAYKIIQRFPFQRGVTAWWSGNTSIHIGIPSVYFGNPTCTNCKSTGRGKLYYNLARKIAGSCRYPNGGFDPHLASLQQCERIWSTVFTEPIPDDPQRLRQLLEHFDPNIYYFNSMIRLPESKHPSDRGCKTIINFPDHDPDSGPEIKPYLLDWTYECWKPVNPPQANVKHVDVTDQESFVLDFYMQHVEGFDPEAANHQGWVTNCYSPFYDDGNPDVSICVDSEHPKFGKFHDFGNPDDNCDFVQFVSRITGWSRRKSLTYIRNQS